MKVMHDLHVFLADADKISLLQKRRGDIYELVCFLHRVSNRYAGTHQNEGGTEAGHGPSPQGQP